MSNIIRVRIAPSPTGNLHIGTARVALFNYLFAKKHKGIFVLRMEDTDHTRSKEEFEQDIIHALHWLGIVPDEGPETGGEYGPYRQSERGAQYQKAIAKLIESGHAFYCFHSVQELTRERERAIEKKEPHLHQCAYRDISKREQNIHKTKTDDYIIRFKTPRDRAIAYDDLIKGKISIDTNTIGDFSIARDIDHPLYNLANVVDDIDMHISHVIRGEDHISNTPKQLLISEAIANMPAPVYGHLPLILGPDRSKMSKRHAATSIQEYQKAGYLPDAMVNFMALLGWNPGTDQEIFSIGNLCQEFSMERVQSSGAIFNKDKLDWMNAEYIRAMPIEKLATLCTPYLQQVQNPVSEISPNPILSRAAYIQKIIAMEQPRMKKLSDIAERTDYFFTDPIYEKEMLRWKDMSDHDISDALAAAAALITDKLSDMSTQKDIEGIFLASIGTNDKGRMLWPLRIALTGKRASPGPFEIMEILGAKESIRRIHLAQAKLL